MAKSPDDEYSDGLEEQIKQLTAERDRLRTALEMIEWIDGYEESTGEFVFCPCCNREKKHGHYDCRLEEALKGTL